MTCEHCGKTQKIRITSAEKIIKESLEYFQLPSIDPLVNKCKERNIAYKRHMILYLLCEGSRIGLKSIGEMFKRDHTTVIHSRNTIKNLADVYSEVKNDIDELTLRIYN